MVNKRYNNKKSFWNTKLLDYLVKYFEVPQIPYVSQHLASNKRDVVDLSEILNPDSIPTYLKNLIEKKISNNSETNFATELLENLYIFKVNTNKSLLHSLLAIFNENYRISSWERREYLASLFSAKLYYDLERDNTLIKKIKQSGLNHNEIRKGLQNNDTTETLKEFICNYFGVNIIIVKDNGIELVPRGGFDKLKPSVLLYQYSFGNLAPILHTNSEKTILTWSKSKLLEALLPVDMTKNVNTTDGSTMSCVMSSVNAVKPVVAVIKPISAVKTEVPKKKESPLDNYKLKELLKLNLAELQILCGKHNVDIKKPATKKGTFKNKTKKELGEDLVKIF